MDKLNHISRRILPIYWAFLTYMLLKPGVEVKGYWFVFEGIDKLIHILIFALLGFIFFGAYHKIKFMLFFIIMLVYSIITEFLQHIMNLGRSGEIFDLIANLLGVILGYYFGKFIFKIFFS